MDITKESEQLANTLVVKEATDQALKSAGFVKLADNPWLAPLVGAGLGAAGGGLARYLSAPEGESNESLKRKTIMSALAGAGGGALAGYGLNKIRSSIPEQDPAVTAKTIQKLNRVESGAAQDPKQFKPKPTDMSVDAPYLTAAMATGGMWPKSLMSNLELDEALQRRTSKALLRPGARSPELQAALKAHGDSAMSDVDRIRDNTSTWQRWAGEYRPAGARQNVLDARAADKVRSELVDDLMAQRGPSRLTAATIPDSRNIVPYEHDVRPPIRTSGRGGLEDVFGRQGIADIGAAAKIPVTRLPIRNLATAGAVANVAAAPMGVLTQNVHPIQWLKSLLGK